MFFNVNLLTWPDPRPVALTWPDPRPVAKYLNFNNKVLAYSNEAVLPFYILHHTIILVVGFFVIRWNIGILPKYMIIVIASFALIMVLFELLVKPFNVGRFLFVMRPKKKPSVRPAPPPLASVPG